MIAALSWYLAITAFGLLGWPLLFRLSSALPDRGYTLSRALGLLLTGYLFWLLASLGFLQNSIGGIIFCAVIVLGLGLWAYLTRPAHDASFISWLRSHSRMVLAAEVLFLAAFIGWTVFRAFNPDIAGTEKPMELAFLNGVRTSAVFPPRDPWLSGYAISYYYFGYVLIAMLADLTGTSSAIAFNLGIALLFALTLLGSYGIVYNMVAARRGSGIPEHTGLAVSAMLGSLFVAVLGNLAGLLELLHALRFPPFEGFWRFIDLEDLDTLPARLLWPPDQWRHWWWWRGSRVIRERDLTGTAIAFQPIDEFPFFSFLLGDMHPHVLALPFVLLVLGLALNALLQNDRLSRAQLVLYTVCFGSLAFLNTWDLPIYLFILVAALAAREIRSRGEFDPGDLLHPILVGLGTLAAGIVAYLPWYISFSSQAGGILPNALFPTRLHQFFIMFGPFLVIIILFLVARAVRHSNHMNWGLGVGLAGFLLAALFSVMLAMGLYAARIDAGARGFLVSSVAPELAGQSDASIQAALPALVREIVIYRLTHPLTAIVLTIIIALCLSALLPRATSSRDDNDRQVRANINPANAFAMILILTAALLTLAPEFVYLRDVFGQRMNTVFKFYYAAWILFAIGAAYAAHELLASRNTAIRFVVSVLLVILISSGLVYPAFAIPSRANQFKAGSDGPTLDGLAFVRRMYPGDYAGIVWLQEHAETGSVILEAIGGQYGYHSRVSMATGLSTILGWPGHERQWRGDQYPELVGSREQDIKEIYDTPNMRRAQELLEQYNVTYIFVGSLERDSSFASAAGIAKFDRFLPVVFRDENVIIYRADQPLVEETP